MFDACGSVAYDMIAGYHDSWLFCSFYFCLFRCFFLVLLAIVGCCWLAVMKTTLSIFGSSLGLGYDQLRHCQALRSTSICYVWWLGSPPKLGKRNCKVRSSRDPVSEFSQHYPCCALSGVSMHLFFQLPIVCPQVRRQPGTQTWKHSGHNPTSLNASPYL